MIKIKRAYDPPSPEDGVRLLVDRYWARGKSRDDMQIEGWFREAAPSDDLRHWYGHDPAKWDEFCIRYFAELDRKPEAWQAILKLAQQGDVTLLFGTRTLERNNATALKLYLEAKEGKNGTGFKCGSG